jgi:hypothetical protein
MSRFTGVVVGLLALLFSAPADGAASTSLPQVSSGARPGPALLYAQAASAPQLQNMGIWQAPPILVSGAEAYRDGEFVYQDFLYDDHGGAGIADPTDPFTEVANLFSPKEGTLTYPTNTGRYGNNAADLVEFRVKPTTGATAFRVTMNTMLDPSVTAFTIALGSSPALRAWPDGAGVSSPAQYFLTVHGSTGVFTSATTGRVLQPAPKVSVDRLRRQVQVLVPDATWNPARTTVRMAMGTGLWDAATASYARPGATASATSPGGASPDREAIFNLAFRTHERVPTIYKPGDANTVAEGGVLVKADGSWWRERDQAQALAGGNVSQFSAEVSFAKLRAKATDNSAVPSSGNLDRIYATHYNLGQGVDYNVTCLVSASHCTGRYLGQLQPYALYVPPKAPPSAGFGLVLSMHGLSANYNEFLGSHEASELADRGGGSILASPEGRGPDSDWESYGEADVFDMWNDIARHYHLNPTLTDISGYSMGGGGTYTLGSEWPDLWGRAFPIVGPPSSAPSFANFRNIPIMAWYAQNDELVGPELSEQAFLNALRAGIRYQHWVFAPGGHITIGNNDEFAPAAAFLGDATVDRNPNHVTYYYDPSTDDSLLGHANHAYWLSGITLRAGGSPGTLDVRSLGRGVGDAKVLSPTVSAGTLNGGSHGPLPYTRRTLAWGPTPRASRANRLIIDATNVRAVTIDAARAGVTCAAKLQVKSDGPLTVHFTGCGGQKARCPRATGRLSGATLGRVRLGMTRARVRRRLSHRVRRHMRYEDFFCLSGGGVRVGYPTPKLLRELPRSARRSVRGRAVIILAANRRYGLHKVRPGTRLAVARRRLKLGRPFRVGRNGWYVIGGRRAAVVLKVSGGRVQEIGVANRSLTKGRRRRRTFLRAFY